MIFQNSHRPLRVLEDQDLEVLLDLPKLAKVYAGNSSLNDRGLVLLSRIKSLSKISCNAPGVTKMGLAHLAGNEKLVDLFTGSAEMDATVMEIVRTLPNLERLEFYSVPIRGEQLRGLDNFNRLFDFRLRDNAGLSDSDIGPIAAVESLTTLGLTGGELGPDALSRLASLSRLQVLHINANNLGDEGMKHLRPFRFLRELRVGDNGISDAGVELISSLRGISSLGLANNPGVTDASVEHLTRLNRLKELNLSGTSFTPSGIQRLKQSLPRCDISFDTPATPRETAK